MQCVPQQKTLSPRHERALCMGGHYGGWGRAVLTCWLCPVSLTGADVCEVLACSGVRGGSAVCSACSVHLKTRSTWSAAGWSPLSCTDHSPSRCRGRAYPGSRAEEPSEARTESVKRWAGAGSSGQPLRSGRDTLEGSPCPASSSASRVQIALHLIAGSPTLLFTLPWPFLVEPKSVT